MGAQFLRESGENGYDFALLLGLELAYAVVGLYHLGRLNEDGLSTGRLIVHNTAHLAFERRCNGDYKTTVAHGWRGILLY